MAGERDELLRNMMYNQPDDLKNFDTSYGKQVDGLGHALGIATRQTGADLKPPADYTQKWLGAMTAPRTARRCPASPRGWPW